MAEPSFFDSAAEVRSWLKKHHHAASELLVGFRKRTKLRPGMSWPEAVDQALCFGWIDGVRRRVDDARYSIRFTPRQPGSTWSAVNIRRVAELETKGLMQPAGRQAFSRRSEKRSRTYSYERKDAAERDKTLEKTLRADKKAWAFFQGQAPSYQRKVVHWVMSGKSDETRVSRLHRVLALFAEGRRA